MDYEIRAMSFGEILDTGFQLLRDHFVLLAGIAAVLYVPTAILNAYLGAAIQAPSQGPAGPLIAAGVGLILLAFVASPIVQVAITYAIGEVYIGHRPTIGDALRFGISILVPLAGTALLMYLAVLLGLALFVLPGVYLLLAFMLVWQVMVLERTFGMPALQRSRELMRGHLARGLGVVVVSSLVILLLVGAVDFILGFVPVLGPIGAGIAQAAGAAYGAAVGVALYFDIRCRKEAFEVEHLAQQVAARGGPPSGP